MANIQNITEAIEALKDLATGLPTAVTTDATLTQEGQAADAKATGDKLASHTQTASTITAGTFAGQVMANSSSQTPAISLIRNSKLVTAETNPSNNGEICWMYS